ncbi:MAG: hypothetical protein PWP65_976 [Clostridia bacterium]|nr:hypothetical protein [Clostridia bacterium]
MARVLSWGEVDYSRELSNLSPPELDEVYASLEERYNCLRSNWDWFASSNCCQDPIESVFLRTEQN